MSKQKESHRGTISGAAGRLQRTIMAVGFGKALSHAVSILLSK